MQPKFIAFQNMRKFVSQATSLHIKKQTLSLPKLARTFQPLNDAHDSAAKHQPPTNLVFDIAPGGCNAEPNAAEAFQILNSDDKPNGYTLAHLVRSCTRVGSEMLCRKLHSYILRSGFVSNVFVATALINFYVRTDSVNDAHKLFDELPEPSVVTWNSLICGYLHSGELRKALLLFVQVDRPEIFADSFSFSAALAACGRLNFLHLGQSIHAKVLKLGFGDGSVISNCLIDMYGKCGSFEDSIKVFSKMREKDIISWNSVVSACARNGSLEQAFHFFQQIQSRDTISYNEIINGIAQFGSIEDGIKILNDMPNPNSSSWNSIITGYVNRNRALEALDFFSKMHLKGVEMDQFTYSSILSGIAGLSAQRWGMTMHCCTIKCGLDSSIVVGSSLIDMYSKCGKVYDAESIFQALPKKNLISWNAMFSGFAQNGKYKQLVEYFERLKLMGGIKPDGITFLNLLSACSHHQMPLETVLAYFESMIEDYSIKPSIEHCCSMIRVFGQNGDVRRGWKMILKLGYGSCWLVWRALLGACGACRNLNVAEIVAAKVIELGGGHDDYVYVVISNLYASYGKWREVRIVRELMKTKGVRKEVGRSWIEVENYNSSSA